MINASIPLQYQGFDAGAAMANAQQMKLRDLMMKQQAEEFEFNKQQYADQQAQAGRQEKVAGLQASINLARAAKANPAYWPQLRQAAIQMGADPASIPEVADEQWLDSQIAMLDLFQKEPEKLSGTAQMLEEAGLRPGTPQFEEAMMAHLFPDKYVPDQGYGVNVYRGHRPGRPQQAPQQSSPPATLTDDDIMRLEGGTAGNGGGNFPQSF